jgi:hypothetical protein
MSNPSGFANQPVLLLYASSPFRMRVASNTQLNAASRFRLSPTDARFPLPTYAVQGPPRSSSRWASGDAFELRASSELREFAGIKATDAQLAPAGQALPAAWRVWNQQEATFWRLDLPDVAQLLQEGSVALRRIGIGLRVYTDGAGNITEVRLTNFQSHNNLSLPFFLLPDRVAITQGATFAVQPDEPGPQLIGLGDAPAPLLGLLVLPVPATQGTGVAQGVLLRVQPQALKQPQILPSGLEVLPASPAPAPGPETPIGGRPPIPAPGFVVLEALPEALVKAVTATVAAASPGQPPPALGQASPIPVMMDKLMDGRLMLPLVALPPTERNRGASELPPAWLQTVQPVVANNQDAAAFPGAGHNNTNTSQEERAREAFARFLKRKRS